MFDRSFFPALVFVALIAATSAFAVDAVRSAAPQGERTVVQLERVVIVAQRHSRPVPVAVAVAQAEAGRTVR